MILLGAILYDPTTAVSKATTSAIAMTAMDTTNLRLAITVPAHGNVRFRLAGTLHGATTYPQILLGVMNGATVIGRASPMIGVTNLAATSLQKVESIFVVSGLTPGAMNCDAAYGVETLVASTGLKYGGPNNATANNAFGAFSFEAWDPMPNGSAFTALGDSRIANLDAAVSSRSTFAGGAVASVTGSVGSVAGFNPALIDVAISTRLAAASYTAPDNVMIAAIAGYVDTEVAAIKAKTDQLHFTVANQVDANALSGGGGGLDAAGVRAAIGLASSNLDTQLLNLVLVAKILRNKIITDPATGTMTVYDDDGATPLLTAQIYQDAAGSTPYVGHGAERRDRLV